MRKIPSITIPVLETPKLTTWELTLKTITPMFGGSAKTREVDSQNPIRPLSVRGHLRFWWRATAGAAFSSAKELFEAEEKLWGSAKIYGLVSIQVKTLDKGNDIKPSEIVPDKGTAQSGPMERFFLHPFNENRSERLNEAVGRTEIKFQCTFTFQNTATATQQLEVKSAIRAWLAFGGIGARTRRGCGSLEATNEKTEWLPENLEQLKNWFVGVPNRNIDRTSLYGAHIQIGDQQSDRKKLWSAPEAWRELGKFWTRFRKGHFTEKHQQFSAMSGSSWHDHQELQHLSRADREIELSKPFYGLPLIYQKFRDSFSGEIEAVSTNGRRMSSPIILKPIAFSDGLVRPLVLILRAPVPTKIKIKQQEIELKAPRFDRVLDALDARDPLDAIHKAAIKSGFRNEVRL
jgi:CRISPR-associated protein Cmr1